MGVANAIYNLGYCYRHGIGTSIDKQKAFELHQKAADLGVANAINNLGYCYLNGIGTSIDNQKAFELFQKAANLGNRAAKDNLALMYENGDGIIRNLDHAIYWYSEQGGIYQYELERLSNIKEFMLFTLK